MPTIERSAPHDVYRSAPGIGHIAHQLDAGEHDDDDHQLE
jgi:hypothetical protein